MKVVKMTEMMDRRKQLDVGRRIYEACNVAVKLYITGDVAMLHIMDTRQDSDGIGLG